jgi:3-oxoacyl-(acyl-carrier-protein) synthase
MRVIRRGEADACLSGGAESKVNYMGLLRQTFAQRLARVDVGGDGAAAVRPFDPSAAGTVLGEGGGLLVVEDAESAKSRGATAWAELRGFAATQCHCEDTVGVDLAHAGDDIAAAVEGALQQAGVRADQVDAVVPMGSGIASVDAAEAHAIRQVFGDRAASLPLVTVAPQVGIVGAGTSALAACVAARCLREQRLPARLSTKGSAKLGVDADARGSIAATLRNVVVTTTGLGGQSAAMLLGRMA